MQLLIHRFYTDNNTSTVGKLILSDIVYTLDSIKNMSLANFNLLSNLYSCYTIELDWKDNKRNISCIPANIYNIELIKSPKFKEVLHVKDVPNRSGILIHKGNAASIKTFYKKIKKDKTKLNFNSNEIIVIYE